MRILLFLLFAGVSITYCGENWFPQGGKAAIHQQCLDLEHPAVVMVVALQPGYEDLPLLAFLRTHLGVKTVALFLTNGEGTPGDSLSRYPLWVTGVRKEEADRVASLLGSEAWFANVPDVPGIESAQTLQSLWDTVGIQQILLRAIRTYRPDAIVFSYDRRAGKHPSIREGVALDAIRRAIKVSATAADTSVSEGLFPWSVSRLFAEKPSEHLPRAFLEMSPVLKMSPDAMARSAARYYHTLRLQIGEWLAAGREYDRIEPDGKAGKPVPPELLVSGLPLVSPKLKSTALALKNAIKTNRQGIRSATLSSVAAAIDNTEHVLATYQKSLTTPEERLMVTWKNGLEALRCSLLGVSATVVQSESLLTGSQLWYLDVKSLKPGNAKGSTDIIFPRAMNGEWTVNETMTYHFPLKTPARFEILTPAELPYVIPVDMYGLRQPQMKTTFPYLIVHKDPDRERNFILRGVLSFSIGPRRTFALRTPLIYDDRSSPVIFEMQNFSRDAFKGMVTLSDSTRHFVQWPVAFTRKDEVHTDTLYLVDDPPAGRRSRLLTLELSGRGGRRSITAKRFEALIDSTVSVGVLSTIDSSPLVDALRVLRQPSTLVREGSVRDALRNRKTILLDRDVLSDSRYSDADIRSIEEWVRNGGHALIFPQHGRGLAAVQELTGATFERIDPLPPGAAIETDSSAVFRIPNDITGKDWEGWVESRAFEEITRSNAAEKTRAELHSGMHLLMSEIPSGKGSVTLVAADILSQLVNYHPGAYRLLANIIAQR
ncbi:MAG: PIG-L family deacetylase [Bacteroidota bacterium]